MPAVASIPVALQRNRYRDLGYWRDIARAHGFKLPRSDIKGFPIRKLMNRYGVSSKEFKLVLACNPNEWRRRNPTWCVLGFVGMLLEIVQNRVADAAVAE